MRFSKRDSEILTKSSPKTSNPITENISRNSKMVGKNLTNQPINLDPVIGNRPTKKSTKKHTTFGSVAPQSEMKFDVAFDANNKDNSSSLRPENGHRENQFSFSPGVMRKTDTTSRNLVSDKSGPTNNRLDRRRSTTSTIKQQSSEENVSFAGAADDEASTGDEHDDLSRRRPSSSLLHVPVRSLSQMSLNVRSCPDTPVHERQNHRASCEDMSEYSTICLCRDGFFDVLLHQHPEDDNVERTKTLPQALGTTVLPSRQPERKDINFQKSVATEGEKNAVAVKTEKTSEEESIVEIQTYF